MTTAIIGTGGLGSVIASNRDALQGADAVILALRFTVLKGVIDEIAGSLGGRLVVVPSNPVTTDAQGNIVRVLPEGQPSGKAVAGWLPSGTAGFEPVRAGGIGQSGRLEVGGDLHGLVVGLAEARSLVS